MFEPHSPLTPDYQSDSCYDGDDGDDHLVIRLLYALFLVFAVRDYFAGAGSDWYQCDRVDRYSGYCGDGYSDSSDELVALPQRRQIRIRKCVKAVIFAEVYFGDDARFLDASYVRCCRLGRFLRSSQVLEQTLALVSWV